MCLNKVVYLLRILDIEKIELKISFGKNAQEVAIIRHDREMIVNRVLEIYDDVIEYEKH